MPEPIVTLNEESLRGVLRERRHYFDVGGPS